MLEANNLCAIIEILIFYTFLLFGLQKCHIKHNLQQMTKKEKYSMVLLVTFMMLLIGISVSGIKTIENDDAMFENIFQMLNQVFQKNVTILLLLKYLFLIIPGVVLMSVALKIFSETICRTSLQIYYFLVICMADISLYNSLGWSYVEAIGFLVLAMIFYCLMICFKEQFTKKKVLFLVLLIGMLIGITLISGEVIYDVLAFSVRQVFIGIVLSFTLKYVRYLRVTLRRVITLFLMLGIIVLQILY